MKKILSLLLVLSMLFTVPVFAYTDIEEGTEVANAVATLSDLEILEGYVDGTFGPEKDITRAEFCAVICRALGLADTQGKTYFSDVPVDHWAHGYVSLAAGQGIVNGIGNGLFDPEANVTYEQAVKMIICALGYEPMAAQKGGWSTGYLVVANQIGVTSGVRPADEAGAANRGTIAALLYNALDIPMMGQTGFGTNQEFKVLDGNNGTPYTTLLTGLDCAKLGGVITADAVYGGKEIGTIEYSITDNYDDTSWKIGKIEPFYIADGINTTDYFGIASEIFVKEIRNRWYIIAIMPGADSEITTISGQDVDKIVKSDAIYYYENGKTTPSKKYLDKTTDIYYNYDKMTVDSAANILSDGQPENAIVTLINNNRSSGIDMISIKDYKYDVISEVDAYRDRFTGYLNGRVNFDFEDPSVTNVIVNMYGEEIVLSDFEENDVVAYIEKADYIEVINLGDNSIYGAVTELGEEAYIDGTAYDYSTRLTLNDEGRYFLTLDNKIFYSVIDKSITSNYGLILDRGINTGSFDDVEQIKMLTKKGDIVIYDIKDRVTVAASDGDVVVYKTNSQNKITSATKLIPREVDQTKEYNSVAQSIGGKYLEDNAVIFDISKAINSAGDIVDPDDAITVGISALVDDSQYKYDIYYNSDAGEYDCLVIKKGNAAIDLGQDLAIIESISNIQYNEEDAWKIRYYSGNDEVAKELIVTDETDGFVKSDATFGTVFTFTANGKEATDFAIASDGAKDPKEDYEIIIGKINKIDNISNGRTNITLVDSRMVTIKGNVNSYTIIELGNGKNSIEVGDWMATKDIDVDNHNLVVIKVTNGLVSDIVSYTDR